MSTYYILRPHGPPCRMTTFDNVSVTNLDPGPALGPSEEFLLPPTLLHDLLRYRDVGARDLNLGHFH